ncbi:unnamed protein product [Ostreobium quekettii]|uniref:Uncharacterized protein n=1 Tax=Ostreobium quekettii TaxID=121088 RepID=A0A8S1IXX1_9CHLO|nr:unnamed protein product [Ostreobium quekettii]
MASGHLVGASPLAQDARRSCEAAHGRTARPPPAASRPRLLRHPMPAVPAALSGANAAGPRLRCSATQREGDPNGTSEELGPGQPAGQPQESSDEEDNDHVAT